MSKAIGLVIVFVLLTIVLAIVAALPTMLLWNWLMTSIFELREINFVLTNHSVTS